MRRLIPCRLRTVSKHVRSYLTFEPLDDDDVGELNVGTSAVFPTATNVNGRYVSSICRGGSKKTFKDVLNWLVTSKQTRLSLPSFKYHDKENFSEAVADYTKIEDRKLTKLSWVIFCYIMSIT